MPPGDKTTKGTAAKLYDQVLSDEEKRNLGEQAKEQADEVTATLVREHYTISHKPIKTDADNARLEEIDRILAERQP